MTFKVKDLMLNVGPLQNEGTCTNQTWTGACVETMFDRARRATHELSLLKAQLRRATMRA